MHADSCYVTLTFDDQYLPEDYGVHVRDLQLFFKRLRKSLGSKKIKFFACGEYGDENLRPHYHSIIFNHDFLDKKLFTTKKGIKLFTSDSLQKLWPYGHTTTGSVTYQSAAYVARYTISKVLDGRAADHYQRIHPLTFKQHQVHPEFMLCSRRPGIGATWLEQYKSDVFPSDFLIVDGKKVPIPKFYTQRLQEAEAIKLKRARRAQANKKRADNTPARLKVRELVLEGRIKQLKREL
ncbi:MAG: replication initiator protein [Microviridae sp.]|nr:MAG: replication initiator protein [Microviridae sp.]